MRDGQKKFSSTKLNNCAKLSGREITRARHHPTLTEPKTTKIDLAGVPTFSARFRAEKSTHSLANAHYQPWPIEYHLSLPSSPFLSWALLTPLALSHGNKWKLRTNLPGAASPKENPNLCTNMRVIDHTSTQKKRSHPSTSSKPPTSNHHINSADCRINHCETKTLFLSQDVSSEGRFLRAFSLAFKEFLCMISCCFISANVQATDNPLTQEKRRPPPTSSKHQPTSTHHIKSADCRINHCETKILFLSQDVSSEGRFLRAFSLAFKEFLCMISCCFTSAILPRNRTIKRMINSTAHASHVGRSPKERLHQPMPEAPQGITKK